MTSANDSSAPPASDAPLDPSARNALAAGPLWFGVAGLLAGLVGWAVVESSFPFFHLAREFVEMALPAPEAEVLRYHEAAQMVALKNFAVCFALLGLFTGMLLGAAEALRRKSAARFILAMIVGVVCGGLLGGVGGFAAQSAYEALRYQQDMDPMVRTLIVQATAWGILGAGAGLAAALLFCRPKVVVLAMARGAMGGVVMSALYLPLAASVFPLDDADRVLPGSLANRISWSILGSGMIGVLVGASLRLKRRAAAD